MRSQFGAPRDAIDIGTFQEEAQKCHYREAEAGLVTIRFPWTAR